MDSNFAVAYEALALSYARLQRYEEAMEALNQGATLPGSTTRFLLPWTHALLGSRGEARRLRRDLVDVRGEEGPEGYLGMFMGAAFAVLGEVDKAFQVFEKGVEERRYSALLLGVEQSYDAVRSDPRFEALRRRVGLHAHIDDLGR